MKTGIPGFSTRQMNGASPRSTHFETNHYLTFQIEKELKNVFQTCFFSAVFIVLMIMTGCFLVTSDPDRTDDRLKLFIAGSIIIPERLNGW